MSDAIELRNIRKTFGKKVAVEDLDLTVQAGSMTGFIGPNGAGKSTTIRMLMAIIFPDSGELSVLGKDSAIKSKDRIGYLPEERGVYKKMKVSAFLHHMGRLKGAESGPLRDRVNTWLDRVGLIEVRNKRCEELSKGMQQKVQFISCVLHEPDLIILDEPFSGLDPVNMRLLRDLIQEQHDQGRTILFSTHVMPQAESLCDHIVMIHNGQKVLDDPLAAIRAKHQPRAVRFELLNGSDPAAIQAVPGVAEVRTGEGMQEAGLTDEADPATTLAAIAAAAPMARVELHRPSLEDIFIEIATDSGESEHDRESLRAELRGGPAMASQEASS